MIATGDAIEMKGKITTVGTDTFDVSVTEIFVDDKWRAFDPTKVYTIATADYTDGFSTSELAVIKDLTEKNKAATVYSPDQLIAINSILKKLTPTT